MNIFLLNFASLIDRRHTLLDGPWSFFKDMAIFQVPAGLQKTVDLVFDEIPIWVQCNNVPLAFIQSAILRNIGSKLGTVLAVDEGDEGSCTGRYARNRVSLNIKDPLRQCLWVRSELDQEEICIILLYEKLPNFCFNCGKLGHVQRDCELQAEDSFDLQFGNWIRASSSFGGRKTKYTASKSLDSRCSPSADYQYSDKINDPAIQHRSILPPIGTESSREKSETDENLVLTLSDQREKNDLITNTKAEKIGGICIEGETLLTTDMQVTPSVQKKKWKRLARANSTTILGTSWIKENVLCLSTRTMKHQNVYAPMRAQVWT